ncbi:DUF4250 domain-containing protein [Fusibacter sp. JL298sf-3]
MEFPLPHDPHLLIGVINMKLRDFYPTLEALYDDMNLSPDKVEKPLNAAGYYYETESNQFHKR